MGQLMYLFTLLRVQYAGQEANGAFLKPNSSAKYWAVLILFLSGDSLYVVNFKPLSELIAVHSLLCKLFA